MTKGHGGKKEEVQEVGAEECSWRSWHAARPGGREMRTVVCYSCIRRRSTDQCHGETAGDLLRQSAAAVVAV
jgi:hypothetical protein